MAEAALPAEYNLTRRFAILSFVCISVITASAWFVISNYLIHKILAREWKATAQIVTADVRQLLADEDFKAADYSSAAVKFEILLEHMRLIPDIVRFKVYNALGVVIWSDDKRLVGQSFSDNDDLRQAMRGEIVADISSLEKPENLFEAQSLARAVEVYVPIFSRSKRELIGVIEAYQKADSIYRDLHEARMLVLAGAVGGGLLLYFCLFAIVRQAARKIKEQHENLLNMQSQLVTSQRMAAVGEVAAAVAHGIGNPLSSIRATAQLAALDCQHDPDPAKGDKMTNSLQSIMQQVDRVQKRMQGLLNFAKPMVPQPIPVDVGSLLRDVVGTLKARFDSGGVSARLEIAPDLPKALLDPNQVEQVFMGLVSNALEATAAGGSVAVRAVAHVNGGRDRMILVSVQDTGEGIPAESRERVFEPFFTTKPHGTGIGLPLARKFVERNGGTLRIAEEHQGGAQIDVMLPVAG